MRGRGRGREEERRGEREERGEEMEERRGGEEEEEGCDVKGKSKQMRSGRGGGEVNDIRITSTYLWS